MPKLPIKPSRSNTPSQSQTPPTTKGGKSNPDGIIHKLTLYEDLMRLNRPIGILLLWWPTFWAILLAGRGNPPIYILLTFALGTILMRSAGCVINDLVDQKFDGQVERTQSRPLAQNKISRLEAYLLLLVLFILAAALLLIGLKSSLWPWALAAIAITIIYPFMKRFLAIPQAVLGVAFSMGIPMAYAETVDTVPPVAWVLMLANFFWALAYDTIYAMVDQEDDKKIGLRSSAIFFGKFAPWAIGIFHGICLLVLLWVGIHLGAGMYFYGSLFMAACFAGLLHNLIASHDRARCFRAFNLSHWFGAIIALGILLQFWLPYLLSKLFGSH